MQKIPKDYYYDNKKMTPENAQDLYITLEKRFKEMGDTIGSVKSRQFKDYVRKERKSIRERQNLLFPILVQGNLVRETQRLLGIKGNSVLSIRYQNSLNRGKKDG